MGVAGLLLVARPVASQERGAIALGGAVLGLGVNMRVLLIGAHPDDEDTFLISWLSRGRHVETAYLSLTRGDGGQNLIGNELGEALGVIRTEELLAARRVDGAQQYFTRAYDFGFSKNIEDTYKHWPKDSIQGDVVRVVRAFRPHVIVGVFSGTPRDGHGHHQVSGLLAREAYDLAGDTIRFPRATFGELWTPLKFYRAARFNPDAGTLRFDAGEYSPLLGRSYAEIAGESRSQHKSQGFGVLQRKGPVFDYLRREASRVNESTPAARERSLFDGIDTTWARFRNVETGARRWAIDSLPWAIAAVRAAYSPLTPAKMVGPLVRVQRVLSDIWSDHGVRDADLESSLGTTQVRLQHAMQLATGLEVEALAERELAPIGRHARVVLSIYNRGSDTAFVGAIYAGHERVAGPDERPLGPVSVLSDTLEVEIDSLTQPRWLRTPRIGAMFTQPLSLGSETLLRLPYVSVMITAGRIRGTTMLSLIVPIIHRSVDPVKGELRRQVASAPTISITLDQQVEYVPANTNLNRELTVHLRSADTKPREVRVTLALPKGLTADGVMRTTRLERYDAQKTVTFRIGGRLPAGEYRIAALAESDDETFSTGYDLIDYDHIRRQRIHRPATTTVSAVDVHVPTTLRVAYVTGVGDNVAPALVQLGVPVTVIAANELASANLSSYTTVVVGPRAYEAHPELVGANARLLEFARKGGTVVVQYGQYEMTQPGILPYPITLARPANRVTEEDAPVTIDAPDAPELRSPNRIGPADFTRWVQERGLYMPRTFDERYRASLSMSDTGEPANRGAILVAPLGDGVYVYTTLSFFRQLPAGVPGAARLFVNLLSAGIASRATP